MNFKMIVLVGIAALFVLASGCATPYDLKKTKPKISYTTTRPVKEVMECIRDKWRDHQTTVYEEKTSKGWLVRHDDVLPGATVAIVVVEAAGSETSVNYHHRTNRIKLHRLEEEIVDCKEK